MLNKDKTAPLWGRRGAGHAMRTHGRVLEVEGTTDADLPPRVVDSDRVGDGAQCPLAVDAGCDAEAVPLQRETGGHANVTLGLAAESERAIIAPNESGEVQALDLETAGKARAADLERTANLEAPGVTARDSLLAFGDQMVTIGGQCEPGQVHRQAPAEVDQVAWAVEVEIANRCVERQIVGGA